MSSSSIATCLREGKGAEEEKAVQDASAGGRDEVSGTGSRRREGGGGVARGELGRWQGLSREFQDLGNPGKRRLMKGSASTGRLVTHPGSKVSWRVCVRVCVLFAML